MKDEGAVAPLPASRFWSDEDVAFQLIQIWEMSQNLQRLYCALEQAAFGETMSRELCGVYELTFNETDDRMPPPMDDVIRVIRDARCDIAARDPGHAPSGSTL